MYDRLCEIKDSTNVSEVRFDSTRNRATVTFKNGEIYLYDSVSAAEFGAIVSADSVGVVVNKLLVQKKTATKV